MNTASPMHYTRESLEAMSVEELTTAAHNTIGSSEFFELQEKHDMARQPIVNAILTWQETRTAPKAAE